MIARWSIPLRLPGATLLLVAAATIGAATPVAPSLISGLVWRNIGPFRGGRVSAVTGAIGEPGVFYAGFPAAGVWRSSNAGATWEPIFDSITTASGVDRSKWRPLIRAWSTWGMGDATGGPINEGDGVYKSTDAGRTWQHLGLEATKHVPSIIVDPRDPNLVLVGALGDVRAKSDQRGVFRSTDGGRAGPRPSSWTARPASRSSARALRSPQRRSSPPPCGTTTPPTPPPTRDAPVPRPDPPVPGSTGPPIEGLTWQEITGGGLPAAHRANLGGGRDEHQRSAGVPDRQLRTLPLRRQRHDLATDGRRSTARVGNGQGGYNCGVYVSSTNPDIVYTINTSSYVSTDGGNTFTGFKGAPGGDDPQQLWIDPTNGQRMLLGMDQGAVVSSMAGAPGAPGSINPPIRSITCRSTIPTPLGRCPAAGRGRHPEPESRQLRRNRPPRLISGGDLGIGHRGGRPVESQHRVRKRLRDPQPTHPSETDHQREPRRRPRCQCADHQCPTADSGALEPA